jgi:branched-chain amino acid transport system permease protein
MNWSIVFQQSITQMIGINAIIYGLAAIGLNLQFGYTGLLNFGQAGFAAIGAYAIAVTTTTFGLNFWLGLFLGIVGAVLFGLLLGIPTLRLRADYLAIVTIAAAEIIRLILRSVAFHKWLGGSDGISGKFAERFYAINPYSSDVNILGLIKFSANDAWVVTVGWIVVALMTLLIFFLTRSPWGRVIKSIREDEDAARSLGRNVFGFKIQALVLGGVIGAFAGMIFAIASQSVQADNYSTDLTFFAYAILILGGTARVLGPVAGTVIFWLLLVFVQQILAESVAAGWIPSSILTSDQVGQVKFIIVGLGLMLLMIFRPQGIFGDRKELALDAR